METSNLSLVTQRYLEEYERILDTMIREITDAKKNGSISHNFMTQMIPHHRAAVRMCENLLQYTTDLPLQELAQTIIRQQTHGIAQMEQLLPSCSKYVNSSGDVRQYEIQMQKILGEMFSEMKQAKTVNNLNADFIDEMIPHHQGAVNMCALTLRYPVCLTLRPILQNIITTQKREIAQMQRMSAAF